jgi:soluble lytic murein transglycosylase-like protein/lipopolysaccharide biosynthesis regulator YciM
MRLVTPTTWVLLLGLTLALPARAEDADPPDDDVTEVEPAARPQPSPASTEDLYDFAALTDVDPRYKVLLEAFRKRQFAQVVLKASDILANARQPVQTATLHLLALAQEGLKTTAEAEKTWKRLAQAGPLAHRARQKLADLAMKRGDVDEALAQLAAVAPWHVQRDAANLQMARLELDRGQIGPARDALDRVHAEVLAHDQKALLALLQAEVARRSGKPDVAVQKYRDAWQMDEEPTSGRAGKRLAELENAPSPSDQIERILRRREVRAGQLQAWLREAEAITDEASGLRPYVQGALLAREKPTRKRAIDLLNLAVERLGDPLLQARALYALGDVLGKDGQDKLAIETLQKIQTLAAGEDVKARALQRLHRLYNAVDQPKEAAQALQNLLDQHPAADERELALWGLAWQKFLAADHAGALKLLVQLEKEFGQLYTGAQQPWKAKAIYWQGRCLQQMGQLDAALDAWTTVASTWAQTYYGVLALDRVREIDSDRAARIQGPPPSPSDANLQAASLDRLRVQKSVDLDEAVLLVRAGLQTEGRNLLKSQLSHGLPRDGIHLLATLYELEGQRRQAYGVMQKHTRRAARPDDSTASAWRQSFPKAFFQETADGAQKAEIPRTFLYSIMRHESAFNPTAASKAGAYGLVQLLPSAAKAIADLHKIPWGGQGALFKPAYSLQIGGLYLAQLLSMFRNNEALAAAAYNAGPYAVQAWHKKWAGQPTDAFVESIPYPATRAYVMQVTATAQTYAWLYPEWQEIERDQLARSPVVPQTLGPFMVREKAAERVSTLRVD